MILIQPKKEQAETPTETQPDLQEKVSGFKFQLPGTQAVNGGQTTDTAIPAASQDQPKPVEQAAKPLLQTAPKPDLPIPPTETKIPTMSDDKYEVVADQVPEMSEAAGDKFTQQLGMLQSAIDGNGQLKDQMENILTFLDDNPEYKENVSPQDVAVFVAACRKVAGITVVEKQTRQTRTTKSTAEVESVLADLADLDFDI